MSWLFDQVPAGGGGGLFGSAGKGQSDGVNRLQILGAMLRDLGQNYQGKPGDALAGVQQQLTRLGDQKKYQDMLGGLFGSANPGTPASTQSVPLPGAPTQLPASPASVPGNQVTARAPGGYHPMIGGGPMMPAGGNLDIPLGATPPSFDGPLGQSMGYDSASALYPMLQAMKPEQGMPVMLNAMQNAQQRQQSLEDKAQARTEEVQDKTRRPATAAEKAAAGLDPKTPAMVDGFGSISVLTDPNQITAYQSAELKQQGAATAETSRHNQATEAQGDTPPDPNTIKYWAQSVAAGGPMPTLGMGKQAAAYRQAILKEVATINGGKGMTGADQNAATGTTKANMTSLGKITPLRAATEAYEGTMLQNMALAQNLMAKGAGTTGIPVLNRWQNYAKGKYAGDPDVAAFQTAIQTVKNEYAKIQSGSIGNAPVTDSARREAEAMLDPSQTPEQIMANFNYMKAETANRTRALRGQEDALRGGLSGKSDVPALDAQNSGGKGGGKADPLGIR